MVRPRKSEPTKERLLDAGRDLLLAHGYHGTGLKLILDTVGVPKGSFYNFFPSKEAYVAAVITQYGQQLVEEFAAALDGYDHAPAIARLWLGFSNRTRCLINDGKSCACLLGVLSGAAGDSALCHAALINVKTDALAVICEELSQAQSQGHLPKQLVPNTTATMLFNGWQGALLNYQLDQCDTALLAQLREFLTLIANKEGNAVLSEYFDGLQK